MNDLLGKAKLYTVVALSAIAIILSAAGGAAVMYLTLGIAGACSLAYDGFVVDFQRGERDKKGAYASALFFCKDKKINTELLIDDMEVEK